MVSGTAVIIINVERMMAQWSSEVGGIKFEDTWPQISHLPVKSHSGIAVGTQASPLSMSLYDDDVFYLFLQKQKIGKVVRRTICHKISHKRSEVSVLVPDFGKVSLPITV
jgi:hypothetical protein